MAFGVKKSRFERVAEAASGFVSSGKFFGVSLLVVLLWLPTVFVFRSVDTWQLVINTATSVLAFLLIALLQNSERRYDRALHAKVDALAAAVEHLAEHELNGRTEDLRRDLGDLRAARESEDQPS
jgi:low affinity Fe/Cu permease